MLRLSVFALSAIAIAALSAGCDQLGSSTESPDAPAPAVAKDKEPTVEESTSANPVVVIETSKGTITAELWPDKSPKTVENFLAYVDKGFFDGTIFHRVIKGFMIQGGGFTPDMQQKPTDAQIVNEARSDVQNDRGTLAMARTSVVDSATAQFFINHADNDFLNHTDKSDRGFGYCVFGKVTEGMDVVDAIATVKTAREDVPVETVEIVRITRK